MRCNGIDLAPKIAIIKLTTHPFQTRWTSLLGAKKPSFVAVFSCLDHGVGMRTTIYVDGFNLYFGCLKRSDDKWLDLRALLFDAIVIPQHPHATLTQIKFFTADIKTKFASRGNVARNAQQRYHQALALQLGDQLEIVNGYYSPRKSRSLVYRNPPNKDERVETWQLEEKQTDVNIAISGYRDAAKALADQVVFVSNDSDLEPALQAIHEDFGDRLTIGLIIPIRDSVAVKPGAALARWAHWTRHYIRDDEFTACHLPRVFQRTGKKPVLKPDYW